MKVLVTDQLFFKVGDECIFVNHRPYDENYRITPEKEYTGIIEEVRPGQITTVSIRNDVDDPRTINIYYDCFSSGANSVKALVEKQEYIARVNLYRSEKVKEIAESIKEEIESLDRYIDSKLELTN